MTKIGPMGWGDPKLTLQQNLVIERNAIEASPKLSQIICTAAEANGASRMIPAIEKIIRSKFLFDSGWSFYVAEQMVYDALMMISQNIGNCVGASHSFLLATRIAHEVLAEGDTEDPLGKGLLGSPYIPYSYGVGRLAGNMLGGGDGSYCGAQIEGTMNYGFLPCFTPGLDRYGGSPPQGDATTGRLFGRSRSVLEQWMPMAKKFDLLEAPRCKTADEAKLCVVEKQIPLQICSGQGFAFWKYDPVYKLNLSRPSGSWAHSMQVMAIFAIKGQWFVTVRNQWGEDAHRGSPEVGIPNGSFTITMEDFASWIRRSETIGIGEIQGLPVNPGF